MKDLFSRYISSEDWLIREEGWDKDQQGDRETRFTLGNGYLGSRGVLEEIPSDATPGTFLAGVYDKSGAQIPELVNLPNPIDFKISIQGEKMGMVAMDVIDHQRVLDLKKGMLLRKTTYANARKQRFLYQSMRFFSMDDIHLGAMIVEFTPLDGPCEIMVQSIIDTSVTNRGLLTEGKKKHFHMMGVSRSKNTNYFRIQTFESKISVGFADTLCVNAGSKTFNTHERAVSLKVPKGQSVTFTKLFSIFSTRDVLLKDLKAQTKRSLQKGLKLGFDEIVKNHCDAWQEKWQVSDIVVKPDKELQKVIRFNIYHLIIIGNDRGTDTSIGAKALAGEGYRGHVFWDAEIFILPFFIYNNPIVAKNMLLYRYNRLPASRKNAKKNGYKGTQFAWESADTGQETTPSWHKLPDGSIIKIYTGQQEHHIVADVAYAVDHYCNATSDTDFMADYGLEIIFETARFWTSRVELNKKKKRYEIKHIIGPDEFREDVNNNAFTNMMARWNLLRAVELYKEFSGKKAAVLKKVSKQIKLKKTEPDQWRRIGRAMYIPRSKKKNLIEQCDGYFNKKDVQVTEFDKNDMPLLPKSVSERKLSETQLIKQADVVMLLYLLSNSFSDEQKKINYDYYVRRTMHKSSLSPPINALVGAEVGDSARAYKLLLLSLYTDLNDAHGNIVDGIHSACLGGTWQALVKGFGGMRIKRDILTFDPRLPRKISMLAFSVLWRNCTIEATIYKSKIKLLFKSPAKKKLRVMVYKTVKDLSNNKAVTFFKKGR
ncbi:glycoside hydrolase family 65 protein [Candidatus Omnitrophota bacterium]